MGTYVRLTAENCDEKKRRWCTILWTDNDKDMQTLETVKTLPASLWILHNKDFAENGQPKKPHYHVVLIFENARYGKAVCKMLNLEPYRLEVMASETGTLKYLIHLDEPEKYKYDISELEGSDTLINKLKIMIDRFQKSDETRVKEILDFITSSEKVLTMKDLVDYCCANGKWSIFKSAQYTFRMILTEHNALFE